MARIKTPNIGEQLGSLGEYIANQRRAAGVTIRQLAEQAGVSNPYLSQIERGLRKPSAEVLQQLAKALRISAETLYVQAGILDPEAHPTTTVEMAVLADPALTEPQIATTNSEEEKRAPPSASRRRRRPARPPCSPTSRPCTPSPVSPTRSP